ncbi:hypothetical protein GCM10010387_50660 [Streptomyces inusitatus]|uniref:Uncharacterized protein n=1 Tax=Streptomyces inusitatus TaxID=68221 RepID=A0A918QK54_9ACTN|nr:hypothetical protein GCM10010387_50660 [Streptomyces inusitatus]
MHPGVTQGTGVGRGTGGHLVEQAAEGVQVAPVINHQTGELLKRAASGQRAGRIEEPVQVLATAAARQAMDAQAWIGEDHPSVAAQHQSRRTEVQVEQLVPI